LRLQLRNVKHLFYRYDWLRLCIKYRWIEKVPAALDFAIECCIPEYVCSIFQDLIKWPETHLLLNESYLKIKGKLLRETQNKLESILRSNKYLFRQQAT